jgi:formamidopyrimidine-DNA glycosylase
MSAQRADLHPVYRALPHASRCRRPDAVRRSSWSGRSEYWCPGCGRTAVAYEEGDR